MVSLLRAYVFTQREGGRKRIDHIPVELAKDKNDSFVHLLDASISEKTAMSECMLESHYVLRGIGGRSNFSEAD